MMTNPPKQRGTAAETAVVRAATAHGIPARRVALAGNKDQGDVHLWDGRVVIEVKSRRGHPSWTEIDGWWHETEAECGRVTNCDIGVLVVKRPGTGVARAGDWFAWILMSDLAWWMVQADDVKVASTVAWMTPQQRVMMPLGDLLALLKAGSRA
jgi:hypothetical protein